MGMKYADIRVGDRIRATWTLEDITRTSEGVVYEKDEGQLWTVNGYLIGDKIYSDRTVYELLDRPAQKFPEEGAWVRFQTVYSSEWKIGQVQKSMGGLFVETLDNAYEPEEIDQFEEITWVAV